MIDSLHSSQICDNSIVEKEQCGRFRISTPTEMIQKISSISIPLVVLFGSQAVQAAEGSFLAFAVCMAECTALTAGAFTPACAAACAALLGIPAP